MRHSDYATPKRFSRLRRALGPAAPLVKRLRDCGLEATRATIGEAAAFLLRRLPLGVRLRVLTRTGTAKRRIDFAPEPLYLEVSSESERQRLWPCAKEPETVEWIMSHARRPVVLYDVGANVGVYSLIAATTTEFAQVFAFEPGYTTYPRLMENIRVNALGDQITAFAVALGETTGVLTFGYSTLQPGGADHAGLADSQVAAVTRSKVLCYRLDDLISQFALPVPTLLKLDVDGGEVAVLKGAHATLRSLELKSVLVEVRDGTQDQQEVERILVDAGFDRVGGRLHEGGIVRNEIWDRP